MDFYPIAIISIGIAFIGLVLISKLLRLSNNLLFIGIFATIIGLLIGALASTSLSKLPGNYGAYIPTVVTAICVFGSLVLFLSKKDLIMATFEGLSKVFKLVTNQPHKGSSLSNNQSEMLIDTSVIIDGRIIDIAKSGFLTGNLIIPRFVLKELQNIADSENSTRREKGRRGLELLNGLKKTKVKLSIIDDDTTEVSEVDLKLVKVARKRGAFLLTTDYNLNKVAKIEGVTVLNINELANAVKPVLVPGEEITVKIIQEGKDKSQGVAYLPDGTMIVVEGAGAFLSKKITVEIKRIFQTDAGKMFFAEPVKQEKPKLKTK